MVSSLILCWRRFDNIYYNTIPHWRNGVGYNNPIMIGVEYPGDDAIAVIVFAEVCVKVSMFLSRQGHYKRWSERSGLKSD
ncbi:MAG: hypothetical protein QXO76_08675 [Thermoproteota archaeon]